MNDKQQKILEMAKDICRYQPCCNDVCNPISACDALKYAERAVEAGYIKVVRCKECKFYNSEYECYNGDPFGRCDHPQQEYDIECYDMWVATKPDDFCSYGERRTDDE